MTDESVEVESRLTAESLATFGIHAKDVTPASCPTSRASKVIWCNRVLTIMSMTSWCYSIICSYPPLRSVVVIRCRCNDMRPPLSSPSTESLNDASKDSNISSLKTSDVFDVEVLLVVLMSMLQSRIVLSPDPEARVRD
jgi:hypothetical protein